MKKPEYDPTVLLNIDIKIQGKWYKSPITYDPNHGTREEAIERIRHSYGGPQNVRDSA